MLSGCRKGTDLRSIILGLRSRSGCLCPIVNLLHQSSTPPVCPSHRGIVKYADRGSFHTVVAREPERSSILPMPADNPLWAHGEQEKQNAERDHRLVIG